jgi:small nuclear ribonucleoprotein (snRNP)-like protein
MKKSKNIARVVKFVSLLAWILLVCLACDTTKPQSTGLPNFNPDEPGSIVMTVVPVYQFDHSQSIGTYSSFVGVSGVGDITITWGDGSVTSRNFRPGSSEKFFSHVYLNDEPKVVNIYGIITSLYALPQTIDVSRCLSLKNLTTSGTRSTQGILESLDVSSNILLEHLDIRDNGISELDLSNNIALRTLDISQNNIIYIDLSANTELVVFLSGGNSLSDLCVRNNTLLRRLVITEANLSTLDVCANDELRELVICRSNLNSIELNHNIALDILRLSSNYLTQIDLRNNAGLYTVLLDGNNFSETEINNLMYSLHDLPISDLEKIMDSEKSAKWIDLSRNPGATASDISIAIEKGWVVFR